MIPSTVAAEVTDALKDFLATGFSPSNPALANVVDDFLADADNPATAETAERSLLYVAATRAKKELLVLGFGEPSPYLT